MSIESIMKAEAAHLDMLTELAVRRSSAAIDSTPTASSLR